ncbi:DNA cytosine methyltransferase [uncultured Brevibacillus sp.]|uniref:DNA cytosine methyltransferase n=1 Tax=uncultured Brevibacillus sp. TaxID=169970 RepID=UPI002598F92D|nr:DNA (cytosine-5-)-methyltransferase [uncultured Brevibacillus sp.]
MRMLSLFSGIGGIDLAAQWAGIETVAFCEIEPFPQKVLAKHWPTVPIIPDVRDVTKDRLEEMGVISSGKPIDIVCGGFPCQPFSVAGQRKGKNDDRDLWPEMFRIIQELKPTWVVGENVANFVNMELERTLVDLESEGYTAQTFIIPACGVDAKHQRYRTFVVAYSGSIRCMECQGQSEEIQQSRTEELQLKESEQSILSELIYSRNEAVAYTYCERLQGSAETGNVGEDWAEINEQFAGFNSSGAAWAAEPDVGRVADGVPDRVDRIKSLGNAVVPQQIYPIFEAIARVEGKAI